MRRFPAGFVCFALVTLGSAGCQRPNPPPFYYFDEAIRPRIQSSCAQVTNGCHLTDSHGNVSGNVDLSSYDSLERRSDVLFPVGPYPVGLILLKGGTPRDISVATLEGASSVPSDIRHGGG